MCAFFVDFCALGHTYFNCEDNHGIVVNLESVHFQHLVDYSVNVQVINRIDTCESTIHVEPEVAGCLVGRM